MSKNKGKDTISVQQLKLDFTFSNSCNEKAVKKGKRLVINLHDYNKKAITAQILNNTKCF